VTAVAVDVVVRWSGCEVTEPLVLKDSAGGAPDDSDFRKEVADWNDVLPTFGLRRFGGFSRSLKEGSVVTSPLPGTERSGASTLGSPNIVAKSMIHPKI
jgi:hypothetical protein